MKKCIIIGGGFAGLTSAAYLLKSGIKIELIEASQKLGGRAYSIYENETGSVVDNGQHIMMGCYRETLKFLDMIEAMDNLFIQNHLKINFIKENFQLFRLSVSQIPYPFNLIQGLLSYKAISFYERLLLLKFFLKLYLFSDNDLKKLSVDEWLNRENQTENIKKAFWEILAVGALNTNTKKASAKIFADILKEIFFRGNKAATIILPKLGLTETYCSNAQKFIEEKSGLLSLSEQVLGFRISNSKIKSISTSKRIIMDFDYVICSVPPLALKKIIPEELINVPRFNYSSILSCHIWLNENKLQDKFYGLINSNVHWIFNHNDHITIVISDANDIIDKSREELFAIIIDELTKFTYIKKSDVKHIKIIKEKRATIIPSNDIIDKRPKSNTEIRNLFLAGDWTETNLPSTIESAVKSGRVAAENVLQFI
jgi:hydroxysqualene dehydroxylase